MILKIGRESEGGRVWGSSSIAHRRISKTNIFRAFFDAFSGSFFLSVFGRFLELFLDVFRGVPSTFLRIVFCQDLYAFLEVSQLLFGADTEMLQMVETSNNAICIILFEVSSCCPNF